MADRRVIHWLISRIPETSPLMGAIKWVIILVVGYRRRHRHER